MPRKSSSGRVLPSAPVRGEEDAAATATSSQQRVPSSSPDLTRSRLPPRSRTGCWTCRTRKVKCDEGRPVCGQCARLQHACDYSPRLSFRHDTARVVEKMQEVTASGSGIWDPSKNSSRGFDSSHQVDDSLPPFAALTNDEDRERKAEYRRPGTYHVVVNPDSFSGLSEYRGVETTIPAGRARRRLRRQSTRGSIGSSEAMSVVPEESTDPNMVILRSFEDNSRKSQPNPSLPRELLRQPEAAPASPSSSTTNRPPITPTPFSPIPYQAAQPITQSFDEIVFSGAGDGRFLGHYRDYVWSHLLQMSRDSSGRLPDVHANGIPIFEEQALRFRPLYHAICALSALSLACKGQCQPVDALQHYQQALQSSLESQGDLHTEGSFFCHFFLLIYEVAAVEQLGSTMWSQHMNQLLGIVLRRNAMLNEEPYAFLVWWIAWIDTFALLTGKGNGEFVNTVVQNNMLPRGQSILPPLGTFPMSPYYPEEVDLFPSVLDLSHELIMVAARLGQLGRTFRAETSVTHMAFVRRQTQLQEIQNDLRRTWSAHYSAIFTSRTSTTDQVFPERIEAVFEQAFAIYHACMLFSYTSMWSSQRLNAGFLGSQEVEEHASQVLVVARRRILQEERFQRRSIAFPVFLAGFASGDSVSKNSALEVLGAMGRGQIGRNTSVVTQLLQEVYELQNESLLRHGHTFQVDWIDMMEQRGLHVLNFGL